MKERLFGVHCPIIALITFFPSASRFNDRMTQSTDQKCTITFRIPFSACVIPKTRKISFLLLLALLAQRSCYTVPEKCQPTDHVKKTSMDLIIAVYAKVAVLRRRKRRQQEIFVYRVSRSKFTSIRERQKKAKINWKSSNWLQIKMPQLVTGGIHLLVFREGKSSLAVVSHSHNHPVGKLFLLNSLSVFAADG